MNTQKKILINTKKFYYYNITYISYIFTSNPSTRTPTINFKNQKSPTQKNQPTNNLNIEPQNPRTSIESQKKRHIIPAHRLPIQHVHLFRVTILRREYLSVRFMRESQLVPSGKWPRVFVFVTSPRGGGGGGGFFE